MQDQQDYGVHYRNPEINYGYNVRSLSGSLERAWEVAEKERNKNALFSRATKA